MNGQRWQNWLGLAIGLYAIAIPWSVPNVSAPTSATPTINITQWSAGLAILIVSLLALRRPERWNEWLTFVFGAWLVVAPWLVGFGANVPFAYNDVLIGMLLVIVSGTALAITHEHIGKDL
jgi:hypothetical protein